MPDIRFGRYYNANDGKSHYVFRGMDKDRIQILLTIPAEDADIYNYHFVPYSKQEKKYYDQTKFVTQVLLPDSIEEMTKKEAMQEINEYRNLFG